MESYYPRTQSIQNLLKSNVSVVTEQIHMYHYLKLRLCIMDSFVYILDCFIHCILFCSIFSEGNTVLKFKMGLHDNVSPLLQHLSPPSENRHTRSSPSFPLFQKGHGSMIPPCLESLKVTFTSNVHNLVSFQLPHTLALPSPSLTACRLPVHVVQPQGPLLGSSQWMQPCVQPSFVLFISLDALLILLPSLSGPPSDPARWRVPGQALWKLKDRYTVFTWHQRNCILLATWADTNMQMCRGKKQNKIPEH